MLFNLQVYSFMSQARFNGEGTDTIGWLQLQAFVLTSGDISL
jgi:hypothetical protein